MDTLADVRLRSPTCANVKWMSEWVELGIWLTRKVMLDEEGKTSGRKDRLRGHIGVRTIALSDGCTIGPPAERE